MADTPNAADESQSELGDVLELEPERTDVEDTPDGGAIVKTGEDEATEGDSSFYDNLLLGNTAFTQSFLGSFASDLCESIEYDIKAREPRDKQYEDGIRRTGMGGDAPGGASFQGASKTVHPMLTQACVDFEARAIKEIMPPGGPAKDFIPGDPTKERLAKARRKTKHMNWQLTRQIPEFRATLEQLLTQVPLGGVQYQRWVWNPGKKRPEASFVPVDFMIIPAAAADFYSAERRTFIEDITRMEFDKRVRDEIYTEDRVLGVGSMPPEKTLAQKATDRVEGKDDDVYNKDGVRRMYEVEIMQDFSEFDDEADDEVRPYIVRLCSMTKKVLGIVRNWEKDDKLIEPMAWVVEWPFVPWRGAMAIGLPQMMAGLPAAATGALRALLDSAHVNNFPAMLKLKGSVQGGQSVSPQPMQVTELEGGPGADDIRKLIMAIPYNPTSTVLYQLLGFLVDAGKDVVRTTFEDLAEQHPNMPVGTTLALIEQGMAVLSAIHGRLYSAMERTLLVLHRINKMYVTDKQIFDETGELLAMREDYQGPMDVIPVADPRIFSEVQRFAQIQVVSQRSDAHPELYNAREVEMLLLERLKIAHPEKLLAPQTKPHELNAVNENVAATLGRPISAFPEQDHLAHIQAHLDYMQSPFFGMMPMVMGKFIPAILQHLIEHMTLWYASRVYEHASSAVDQDFAEMLKFKDADTRREVDKVMAVASGLAIDEAAEAFKSLPPIIAKAFQMVQQLQQSMQPQDPAVQAATAVETLRGKNQQALEQTRQHGQAQIKSADVAQRMKELQLRAIDGQRDDKNKQADRAVDVDVAQMKEQGDMQRAALDNQTKLEINTADNDTAMAISTAETLTGHRSTVSTGTGINPGE
jgi:hypothetical protein